MYCPTIYHDATRWATAKVDWRLIISSSAALTNDPPAFLVHGMHSPNNPSALHVAAPPAQPVAPSCTCQLSSLLLRQTTAAKSPATPEPPFANQYAFHRQFKGLQGPQIQLQELLPLQDFHRVKPQCIRQHGKSQEKLPFVVDRREDRLTAATRR